MEVEALLARAQSKAASTTSGGFSVDEAERDTMEVEASASTTSGRVRESVRPGYGLRSSTTLFVFVPTRLFATPHRLAVFVND
jgi:hypothetical protein